MRETLFFRKRKGFLALFPKETCLGFSGSGERMRGSNGQPALPAFGKRKGFLALFPKENCLGFSGSGERMRGSNGRPALQAFGKELSLPEDDSKECFKIGFFSGSARAVFLFLKKSTPRIIRGLML